MNKQPEKTAQTKANLSTAFWELYRDAPMIKISVKDITDRAGYYRSTFYFHFKDIYHIVQEKEEEILEEWKKISDERWDQHRNQSAFENLAEFYERNGEYMSILLSPKGDPAFMQKIKDTMRPKMFARFNLADNDIKGALAFEFVVSAMVAFLTEWYRNAEHMSAERAVSLLQELLFGNIEDVISGITVH